MQTELLCLGKSLTMLRKTSSSSSRGMLTHSSFWISKASGYNTNCTVCTWLCPSCTFSTPFFVCNSTRHMTLIFVPTFLLQLSHILIKLQSLLTLPGPPPPSLKISAMLWKFFCVTSNKFILFYLKMMLYGSPTFLG